MANLPIDMKKFKKVHGDEKSTTLEHEDGHKITIAHAHLSPKFVSQLKSFPKRLEVGKSERPAKAAPKKYADGGAVDDQVAANAAPEAPPIDINPAAQIPAQFANPQAGAIAAEQGPQISGQPGVAPQDPGQLPYGITPEAMAAPQGAQTPAPAAPKSEAVAPPAQMPQPAPAQDPYGIGAQMNSFGQGAEQYKAGLQQQAQAQAAMGQAQAETLQQSVKAQQTAQEDYKAHYADLDKERQAFQSDIQNQHIDPNHYLSSLDTGNRISTAIGLLLGGIGGGMTHQENPALKFLNSQIDRDISAQQQELGKKENLLSANLKQFGNMRDATDMTRVMQNDLVKNQLQEAGAKAAGPMAQAVAMQAAGQFDVQNSALLGQMAMRKTLMSQIGNAGPGNDAQTQRYLDMLRVADPKRAEELEKRYVPEVGVASIPVDQSTRNVITERRVLGNNIQKLEQFQKQYGGTLTGITDPTVRAQGEALAKQVQDQYRRANQQGVFKPAEAEFVNGVIADSPSSIFSKYTKLPAYKAAADINQGNLTSLYSSLGIRNPSGAQAGTYTPSSFKPAQ